MIEHYNIKVSGIVQGVYYRASTKAKAEELNLTGFVRNEADGSVYIEAEGQEEQLNQLVEWCKIGPTHAVVENVQMARGTNKGFRLFDIRR